MMRSLGGPILVMVLGLGIVASVTPAKAQTGEPEKIGDWTIQESGDPFDDNVKQTLMYLMRENRQSIQVVALACVARPGSSRIDLRIVHPYLIPDSDDQNLVQVRFGADEARVEWGNATTDNTRTDLTLTWRDIEALRATPNLAVRITEGASHSNDQYTEAWTAVKGTVEALDRTMARCAPAGG